MTGSFGEPCGCAALRLTPVALLLNNRKEVHDYFHANKHCRKSSSSYSGDSQWHPWPLGLGATMDGQSQRDPVCVSLYILKNHQEVEISSTLQAQSWALQIWKTSVFEGGNYISGSRWLCMDFGKPIISLMTLSLLLPHYVMKDVIIYRSFCHWVVMRHCL